MDEEILDEETSTAGRGIIGVVLGTAKALDGVVVNAAKSAVSIVSPDLAKRMVSLDRNFKKTCFGILKAPINFGLGLVGLSVK
ncbi:MAG: hypothetical protein HXX08_11905 [Chloroflexi bacterium]|uniref:Uncharacterized protein n=1 Tax=Candidatus Chlorohelix allophototropha TaxID=3003348 RepID=A0A8T7M3P4_9CHLR|nr:hypothetical protein [Chloroflexota bacterium]WJW65945.1 hypothetical protein OZ401_001725 [Chloroflexota bacterium L227-S17]